MALRLFVVLLAGSLQVASAARVAKRAAEHPDCGAGGPLVPPGTKEDAFFANTSIVTTHSAETIWKLLLDANRWGEWSDVFSANMEGEPRLGLVFFATLVFETAPLLLRKVTLPMKITVYEEGKKICWATGAHMLLWMTHCYVICPTADTRTLWNYEYQKGILTNVTYNIMAEHVTNGFAKYNEELVAEAARLEDEQLGVPLV